MYEYRCKIVKIIDGDTVDVDIDLGFGVWMHKERIRLYGIDTPESRTRDLDEKKYGLIAKGWIEKFMPVGSMQTLITQKDKSGKFGRILGKFRVNDGHYDIILNDWMISNHHAVAYYGQSKQDIAEQHIINRGHVDAAIEEN
jgi:micrococcal nuclease|tara:strand:+ start:1180 stop:1605 length:426 start_codon:yes stop_codon:yes gene_type:complete